MKYKTYRNLFNIILKKVVLNIYYPNLFYLKPTEACQRKASNKKRTGTIGKISTIGLYIEYSSGNFVSKMISILY